MIVEHMLRREVAPGHWAPVRPIRRSVVANRAARRCATWGHCHHPANDVDPVAYCCRCGRARHLIDRLMGR